MHPAEVAEDEGVPGLGLVVRAVGQAEVPGGVLLPGVLLEVGVLVGGPGWTSPQSLSRTYCRFSISFRGVLDRGRVDVVAGHDLIVAPSPHGVSG